MTDSIAMSDSASAYGLSPLIAFGVSGQQVEYIDEERVSYRCGQHIAISPLDGSAMRFVMEERGVKATGRFAVSPNLRYMAVCEKAASGARIGIFQIGAINKRLKSLILSDASVKEYIDVCFSGDNKYLVCITGAPDYNLLYYNWDKAKLLATSKLQVPVTRVSFSPFDNAQLCVTGPKYMRIFRSMEGQLKPFNPLAKKEPQTYTDHRWVSEDMVIISTDTGDVIVVDDGEWKHTVSNVLSEGVFCIAAYSRGFVAGGNQSVAVYARTDEQEVYIPVKKAKISKEWGRVTSVSVSENEESAVLCVDTKQVVHMHLSLVEVAKDDSELFQPLFGGFHSDAITGVSVCLRRPLVMTCGSDKTVRVWNYASKKCELVKTFSEKAFSISCHPLGIYAAVGFEDKLRLLNVLVDDLTEEHSFAVKKCQEVVFSNSGHLFAAASATTIMVFNTYTFQSVAFISKGGHIGPVTGLAWTPDDKQLVSAGYDGCLYEWDAHSWTRKHEHVLKGCKYSTVTYSKNGTYVVASGSDQRLRVASSGSVIVDELIGDVSLKQIVFANNNRSLFMGTDKGDIMLRNFPVKMNEAAYVFPAHSGEISRVCATADDAFVFSVGEDGVLWMYEQVPPDRRGNDMPPFTEVVFMSQLDLQQRDQQIAEYKSQVESMQSEFGYEVKKKEREFESRMTHHTSDLEKDLRALELKYKALKQEKETQQLEAANVIQQMEQMHMKAAEELESLYERKLMNEVQRFTHMERAKDELRQEHAENLYVAEKRHKVELEKVRQDYDRKLQDQDSMIHSLENEVESMKRVFEEQLKQQEDEYESEIVMEQESLKKDLQNEREKRTQQAISLADAVKAKERAAQDAREVRSTLTEQASTIDQLNGKIRELEKTMTLMQKNISERDAAISQNEKRIFQLKQQNHELEKFKFVLDYKVKELRDEMEPREQQLAGNRDQMRAMEHELLVNQNQVRELQTKLGDQEARIGVLQHNVTDLKEQVHHKQLLHKAIVTEIDSVYKHHETSELRDKLRTLWEKYVGDKKITTPKKVQAEQEMTSEFGRQREWMEKTISTMKRSADHTGAMQSTKERRAHEENAALLKEVNELRREKKGLVNQLAEMEANLKDMQAQQTVRTRSRGQSEEASSPSRGASRGDSRSGKLIKGSTRAWSAELSSRERQRVGDMVNQLEDNTQEMELQRNEIKRLREQMQSLMRGDTPPLPPPVPLEQRSRLPAI